MSDDLYLYMDESGLINQNESVAIYGGIWFQAKKQKNDFKRKYFSIISELKCKYCSDKPENCNKKCPEIKHNMIEPKHLRRLTNLIKQHSLTYAVIISNNKLNKSIIQNKGARGRFKDYSIKRIVKEVVRYELNSGNISNTINLVLSIDQSSTKSNGYYNLKESIYEELVNGVSNFNYAITFTPILDSMTCDVHYCDSKDNYLIQAADIFVGNMRHYYLTDQRKKLNSNTLVKLYLP
ncbi:DUF3800 domain-containing protein [Erysipelotrichaceae bacterium OttesenSCG-928-M19]|nr:DUF3800 domain-containing protein [Erysipelotrichaceae bacterium OttesenSCG-928-M19]